MQKISIKQKIILIIFGLFLSVILLEIGLRIGGFVFLSLQEYRNRISIKQRGTYRIMCLGESTTALGGKNSYPSQLQEVLNQQDIGIKFSVINKGIPGINTTPILAQLEDNLTKYKPDMVMTMMGLNDFIFDNCMEYENSLVEKTKIFLKSFKTYKLVKLLRQHCLNKKTGICKIEGDMPSSEYEKENIITQARYLIGIGNYNKAEEMYKKAIKINPKDDLAYIELGWHYSNSGRLDEAEKIFKKAIEINPDHNWAYAELGWHYSNFGRFDEAEKIVKKAIEVIPDNDRAYLQLGMIYCNQGKSLEGIRMFRKTIEINPENDWAYARLGSYYNNLQKRNSEAEEYFRKANKLRLGTYNPITRHNYQRLKKILAQRGIRLVCVQYPMRSVEPLKKMFNNKEGIIFVNNERVFKDALKFGKYEEYFLDNFAGDFGHCTKKGNRLLAENIADVILKECFNNKEPE